MEAVVGWRRDRCFTLELVWSEGFAYRIVLERLLSNNAALQLEGEMKLINSLGAAIALVMAAAPAFAANWVYILTNGDGTDYYYDGDTIQRSGNQVTVWRNLDHSRNKKVKYREEKDRVLYDCSRRTFTFLNSIEYYPDGKVESFAWEPHEQKIRPIPPETSAETILEAVCAATAP